MLMSLPAPSILDYDRKQILMAVWQFFPLWVSMLQQGLSSAIRSSTRGSITQEGLRRQSVKYLRVLYAVILLAAAANQMSTMQVMAMSKMFPHLFAEEYRHSFDFSNVFVPKAITASTKMDSIGSGIHLLLQYDELIGSTSMVLWALVQFFQARRVASQSLHKVGFATLSLLGFAITGPLGLAVAYVWARDELVFAHSSGDGKKKS
ncbi:MAG: hypothetical protein Q9217_004241 [Psora testacea]